MHYDKGPQLTVGMLKRYLSMIPDDVKISIGIGDARAPAHYIDKDGGQLLLHPDMYMINAAEHNLKTIIKFNTKENENSTV